LQVCCNVSSVKLWPVDVNSGRWTRGTLAYEKTFNNEAEDIWSELQVSVCDDKSEPTLGYAEAREGIKCTHYNGQTLTILSESIEMNRWYLVCYTKSTGCSQCHLEAMCDNDFTNECAEMWMLNSVSAITNESMTMWLKIGKRYPFIDQTSVEITVKDQARGKRILKYERLPELNKQIEVELRGVQPNGWYLVEACLRIKPPKTFTEKYDIDLNEGSRQMCKKGSYRTKESSATLSQCRFLFDLYLFVLLRILIIS
ncbi:unnamed protein product, partial [Toxocara canis]|uniref:IGv domain-containing protein n=1 Tax=Toxocara canis TaxID=6265 RepID=A0A183U3P3_TOXCA